MKRFLTFFIISFILFTSAGAFGENIYVSAPENCEAEIKAVCITGTTINANYEKKAKEIQKNFDKQSTIIKISLKQKHFSEKYNTADSIPVEKRAEINIKSENKKEVYYDFGNNDADGDDDIYFIEDIEAVRHEFTS